VEKKKGLQKLKESTRQDTHISFALGRKKKVISDNEFPVKLELSK